MARWSSSSAVRSSAASSKGRASSRPDAASRTPAVTAPRSAASPTVPALKAILGKEDQIPAQARERAKVVAAKHVEGVRAAHKAGVRIAAGTDSGTPFNRHEAYALELKYLTEAGLSREEALVAAT